jgi:hypothetical protein
MGVRVRAALAVGVLAWGGPARADCPPVDYPPGVDLGAATVRAAVRVDPDGRVSAADWVGPEPLVDAVAATLAGCELPPGDHRLAWPFDAPLVNVAGTVRALGDQAPVRTVIVVGERTARTEPDGSFALRNVAPGAWPVRIADPAWRLPDDAIIEVLPGERVDVALWVAPDRAAANEIVALYDPTASVGVVRTVDVDRARAIPGTLGDPLRALSQEPGLSRSPYDAGWLLVRGGDFDEVGLYLDGVRVPLVYHLGGFASVLHPEMVEAVRFWPGLFPSRYGGALSGAVDLVPRPVGDRPRAVGGVNVVFAHASAETPTPWGGIALAARRSYLDAVLAAFVGGEGARIAPRFWDLSGQLRVGDARFTALVMRDTVDAPSFSSGGVLEIVQQGAQVQGVIPVAQGGRGVIELRPYVAWTQRALTGDVLFPEQIDEVYPGLRVEARSPLADRGQALGGIELQRRWFRLDKDDLVRPSPVWQVAPYAGLAAGRDVRTWTEARFEALIVEGDPQQPIRTAVSPRAGVDWDLGGGLELRGAFGRLHQPPPPSLLLAVADGAYLALERSDQVTAGFALTRAALTVEAEAWARRASDLAELELDGSIGPTEGRAHGVEARIRGVRDGFDGSVLYQLTRTLEREDPGDPWRPGAFDAPHRFEVLVMQQLPRAWVASARFRATSGFARVRVGLGIEPTEAYDLLQQRTVRLDLGPWDPRLAPFHALDLRIGRRFTFRRWQLDAGLEVQNAYSRRVVEPVITGFGDARPPYGFGLPVLPIFSLDARLWP